MKTDFNKCRFVDKNGQCQLFVTPEEPFCSRDHHEQWSAMHYKPSGEDYPIYGVTHMARELLKMGKEAAERGKPAQKSLDLVEPRKYMQH